MTNIEESQRIIAAMQTIYEAIERVEYYCGSCDDLHTDYLLDPETYEELEQFLLSVAAEVETNH